VSSGLQDALAALLESPPLDTHIAACEENPASNSTPFVFLLFPRFREDEPDIQSLAEFLWHQAVNYVIPIRLRKRAREEIENAASGADFSPASRLIERTKKTFLDFNTKYPHRASEVGELMAYLIALKYLDAVQIASKMALKTSNNMPVHGLDGIHACFLNDIMTLYFLEAKLSASAKSGVEKYTESVKGFGDNRKQYLLEYEIIADLNNLDSLSPENRNAALEYLDVYGSVKSQRLERSVGVICYSDKTVYSQKIPKDDKTPPSAHESAFASRLSKNYDPLRKLVAEAFAQSELDISTCKVFFIPFPDVDLLRTAFYEVMNG